MKTGLSRNYRFILFSILCLQSLSLFGQVPPKWEDSAKYVAVISVYDWNRCAIDFPERIGFGLLNSTYKMEVDALGGSYTSPYSANSYMVWTRGVGLLKNIPTYLNVELKEISTEYTDYWTGYTYTYNPPVVKYVTRTFPFNTAVYPYKTPQLTASDCNGDPKTYETTEVTLIPRYRIANINTNFYIAQGDDISVELMPQDEKFNYNLKDISNQSNYGGNIEFFFDVEYPENSKHWIHVDSGRLWNYELIDDTHLSLSSSFVDSHPEWFNKWLNIRLRQRFHYEPESATVFDAVLNEFVSDKKLIYIMPSRTATCVVKNTPTCSYGGNGSFEITIDDPILKNKTSAYYMVTVHKLYTSAVCDDKKKFVTTSGTFCKMDENFYSKTENFVGSPGNKIVITSNGKFADFFEKGYYGFEIKCNEKDSIYIKNVLGIMDAPDEFKATLNNTNSWNGFNMGSCQNAASISYGYVSGGQGSGWRLTDESLNTIYNFSSTASQSFLLNYTYNGTKVQIVDGKNCKATINSSSQTYTPNISKPTVPLAIQKGLTQDVKCYGEANGSIAFSASGGVGGYQYTVTGGSYTPGTNEIKGLSAGTYFITVKDASGCEDPLSGIEIKQPDKALTIDVINTKAPTCFGGTNGEITSVVVSGGNTALQYSTDDATWKSLTDPISGYSGGASITVYAKDSKSCHTSRSTTIPVAPTQILPGFESNTNSSCALAENGGVVISPSGGTATSGYTINISKFPGDDDSGKRTSASYSTLKADSYTARISDDRGCYIDAPFTINTDNQYLSFTATPSPESCDVANDGKLTIGITPVNRTAYPLTLDIGSTSQKIYSPSTSYTFEGLDAKTYTISVTDNAGCAPTNQSKEVKFTDTPLSLSVSGLAQPICPGKTGGFTINRTYGASTFNYTVLKDGFSYASGINPAADANSLTNLPIGNYSITVKDSKNCTANVTKEIKASGDPVSIAQLDLKDQSCTGVNNGLIKVQAASTAGLIDSVYLLGYKAKNLPTYEFINLPAANYQVKAIDINGCSKIQPYTIANLGNQPSLSKTGSTDVACAKATNGSLTVSANQALKKMPYWFKITGAGKKDSVQISSDVHTFTGLTNTAYDVSIRDNDNCRSAISSYTINPITNPLSIQITKFDSVACDNASNGVVYFAVNGSMAPIVYNYQFKTGSIYASQLPVNNTYSGLSRLNTYKIKVTDNFGCSDSTVAFQPPRKVNTLNLLEKGLINISCPEKTDGQAFYQRINGLAYANGFDYKLTDAQNVVIYSGRQTAQNLSFQNLSAGNYQLAVTDAANCLVNKEFTLTKPFAVEFVGYDSVFVKAKGQPQGKIAAYIDKGNYKYKYQLLKTGTTVGDSIVSFGTTPQSVSNQQTTLNFNSLYAGIYKVQVRDTAGCNNGQWLSRNVHIVEPANYLALTVNKTDVRCFGESSGSLVMTGSGGWGNYTYSRDSVNFNTVTRLESLPANTYKLFVKDKEGVIYKTTAKVNEPAILQPTLVSTVNALCSYSADGKAILSVKGGNGSYQVSDNQLTWQNDTVCKLLSVGPHTIYVQDRLGCKSSAAVNIVAPLPLAIADTIIKLSKCSEKTGAIKVVPAGGAGNYTYKWESPDTTFVGSDYATNLPSEIYTLTLMDNNRCSQTFTFAVSDSTMVDVKATSVVPVSCWGKADGAAQLGIVSGKQPVTITWPNGQTGLSMNGLKAGNQIVWVVDGDNCKRKDTITITTPDSIYMNKTISDPLCLGSNDGGIQIAAAGGTGSYSYKWDNGSSSNRLNNLNPGNYAVSVTDANKCSKLFTFNLSYQKQIKPNLGPDLTLCKGNSYPLSPGSFALYKWKSDAGFTSYDSLIYTSDPGNYMLEVADWENCIGRDTIRINYSENTLNAEFLANSEAMVGDTVMLIEISWPMPDSLLWKIPSGATVVEEGEYYRKLIFKDPGEYKLDISAYRADCFDIQSKAITIVPFDESKKLKSSKTSLIQYFSLYPNPNSGNFSVDVRLSEKKDGMLRVVNVSRGLTVNIRPLRNSDIYSETYALSNLPAGIYALYLQVGNETRTITFIVQ